MICAGTLNAHLDAKTHPEVLARYINDIRETDKLNARFVKDRQRRRVFVQAVRDIDAGEEIYAFYGEGYWRNRPFFAPGDESMVPVAMKEDKQGERR